MKLYGYASPEESFNRNLLIVQNFDITCLSHQAGEQIFLFQSMKKKQEREDEDSSNIKIKLILLDLLSAFSFGEPTKQIPTFHVSLK